MSISLGSTFATYNYYAKNSASAATQEAADPEVANDTAYYQANISKITNAEDFVNNYRLFNYAMTAYGLTDMAYAKEYMKQVITSDLSDQNSLANKLGDSRFVNFAKAFSNLNPNASSINYVAASTADVVGKYVEQSLENSVGQDDQGVQLAMYFKRTASSITSAYGLLGDPAIWQVIQTVYGLPANMGGADAETQKAAVDAKVNVADLQDPAKVDALLQRFTAMWDATQNTSSDPVLMLFDSTDGLGGTVGSDVSASILNLSHGG